MTADPNLHYSIISNPPISMVRPRNSGFRLISMRAVKNHPREDSGLGNQENTWSVPCSVFYGIWPAASLSSAFWSIFYLLWMTIGDFSPSFYYPKVIVEAPF